jgi:hypothetical protein
MPEPILIRPYQLACLVCRVGGNEPIPTDDRIAELGRLIREDPDRPLTLVANIGDAYAWQDPGNGEDTREGPDFNRKRDLDILHRLDLAPGSTLPARTLLKRFVRRLPTVEGICGYAEVTGPAWRGCDRAFSGDYERGVAAGTDPLIPTRRADEMAAEKQRSLAALEQADTVRIRPHILLCSICQWAGGTRPPFAEDNLPEFLQMILTGHNPQVELVPQADWDMCAPCPWRVPGINACITGQFACGGVYNEMKDLEVLQALGLTYGTVMPARDIYKLIFERIPTTRGVCALTKVDVADYSVWKDGCSTMTEASGYDRGRVELWEAFGCEGQP